MSEKKAREIRVFQESGYLSLDFMNQKGHLIRKKQNALEKSEVPVEKAEPLVLELQSFLDCVRGGQGTKDRWCFWEICT